MIPTFISFYVLLFLGAVLIKKSLVGRKIGKSPLIFAQKISWTEALMKRSVFLFFPLWLGGLLAHSFFSMKGRPIPVLFQSQFLSVLGVVLLYLAWIFFVICLIQMRDAWRFGIDSQQTSQLIRHGIYSKIRHPIYTSVQIALVGSFLVFPNIYFLVVAVSGIIGNNLLAIEEEKFLKTCFAEYESYMKQTGRFYPKAHGTGLKARR